MLLRGLLLLLLLSLGPAAGAEKRYEFSDGGGTQLMLWGGDKRWNLQVNGKSNSTALALTPSEWKEFRRNYQSAVTAMRKLAPGKSAVAGKFKDIRFQAARGADWQCVTMVFPPFGINLIVYHADKSSPPNGEAFEKWLDSIK